VPVPLPRSPSSSFYKNEKTLGPKGSGVFRFSIGFAATSFVVGCRAESAQSSIG
jgi:hypothetical protein